MTINRTKTKVAEAKTSPKAARDLWVVLLKLNNPLQTIYRSAPMERIELVKAGAPANFVVYLITDMAISKERLYKTVGVARATIDRKVRAGERLNSNESERILDVARLVGQVEQMVAESGNGSDLDAGKWVADWLDRPLPALGGKRPGSLMDTSEGRSLVSDLLAQMQSGAYA
jgi:putative toxin-antitoxin system antitoxin component (TIGR02293 family)